MAGAGGRGRWASTLAALAGGDAARTRALTSDVSSRVPAGRSAPRAASATARSAASSVASPLAQNCAVAAMRPSTSRRSRGVSGGALAGTRTSHASAPVCVGRGSSKGPVERRVDTRGSLPLRTIAAVRRDRVPEVGAEAVQAIHEQRCHLARARQAPVHAVKPVHARAAVKREDEEARRRRAPPPAQLAGGVQRCIGQPAALEHSGVARGSVDEEPVVEVTVRLARQPRALGRRRAAALQRGAEAPDVLCDGV